MWLALKAILKNHKFRSCWERVFVKPNDLTNSETVKIVSTSEMIENMSLKQIKSVSQQTEPIASSTRTVT